jgi:thermitase
MNRGILRRTWIAIAIVWIVLLIYAPRATKPAASAPEATTQPAETKQPTRHTAQRPPDEISDGTVIQQGTIGPLLSIKDDTWGERHYSARHLTISAPTPDLLEQAKQILLRAGYQTETHLQPYGLLRAKIPDNATPENISSFYHQTTQLLTNIATVALDPVGRGGMVPSDPNYSGQWHHLRIDTPAAWDQTTGSTSIVVAVLDSGINASLPEFAGRLLPGYDFVNADNDPDDDHGHGTICTAILAANANNGVAGAGVDWTCNILPLKVLGADNQGFYSDWTAAINYAVNQGCRVINLSAGGPDSDSAMESAITNAIAHGCIFVTITHNQSSSNITFPGRLPQVITVGATGLNDQRAGFSNWGPEIDLVAPGEDIQSIDLNGQWQTNLWGTSYAAPQVAGAAALLLALNPSWDARFITALLTASADDQVGDAQDTPGHDDYYGWGRLNIHQAMVLAQTELRGSFTPTDHTVLSWNYPSNAPTRAPYLIAISSNLTDWVTNTHPDITYAESALWTNTISASTSNQFYRLLISP